MNHHKSLLCAGFLQTNLVGLVKLPPSLMLLQHILADLAESSYQFEPRFVGVIIFFFTKSTISVYQNNHHNHHTDLDHNALPGPMLLSSTLGVSTTWIEIRINPSSTNTIVFIIMPTQEATLWQEISGPFSVAHGCMDICGACA